MKDQTHSRRDMLKLLGAAPLIGGAAAQAQAPTPAPAQGAPAQGAGAPGQGQGRGGGRGPVDFWPGLKHLLFVSDTQTGYQHDSISHAMATVEKIGRESKTYMTMIKTDSQLITSEPIKGVGQYAGSNNINARILPFYDAIFMLPSGWGTMGDDQKAALLAFVHDQGKGLIVGHAAVLAFSNEKDHTDVWPEWHEMLGAGWGGEFNANTTVIVEDTNFPGADAFGGPTFMFSEQHAVWVAPYSRDKSHVIMRLDPDKLDATNRARRPDGDFPVVIAKQYGKGRVFNTGWGHNDQTWDDPRFQKMILEGIKWAMGITPADVTPRPFPTTKPMGGQ
jgi:type 1 glutamine amidotransferase